MKALLRLLAALFLLAAPSAVSAQSIFSYTANPSIANANTLFYCPQQTSSSAGTDYKCSSAAIAAYNYSLMSGDCTASGTGAITCTKTSGTAFSALATTVPGTGITTALTLGVTGTPSSTTFWRGDGTWATPSATAGVSSFSTTCPPSGPSTGAYTLANGANVLAKSTAYTATTAECGTVYEVTGTTTITMPTIASGLEYTVINQNAPGGATVTVAADAGHTIGNNSAASITLAPGQSVGIAAGSGGTPTNWDLGPGAVSAAAAGTDPGYVTGQWYTGVNLSGVSGGGAALTTGTAYCSVQKLMNPVQSGGGSGTIGSLALRIPTAGTTTITEALYQDGLVGGLHRPKTLLGYTAQVPNNSVATLTGALNAGVSVSSNIIWTCATQGDSAGKVATMSLGANIGYVGNISAGSIIANSGEGVTFPVTYGASASVTWPTDNSAATFSEGMNAPPLILFQFSSIP